MFNRRNVLTLGAVTVAAGCSGKFQRYTGPRVTKLAIFKSSRKLYLFHEDEALRVYDVDLGFAPIGDKKIEGDGKTPEGHYTIDKRNPRSTYHLSIGISYPNDEDRREAKALDKPPGGDIFIHGRVGWRGRRPGTDWTWGCISVSNKEMEEIYSMVALDTPIEIIA